MAEEDESDDAGEPVMEPEDIEQSEDDVEDGDITSETVPDDEKASPQTVAASEKASVKAIKGVKKKLKKPKDAGGDGGRSRDAPAPTFKAMFDGLRQRGELPHAPAQPASPSQTVEQHQASPPATSNPSVGT